MGCNSDYRIFEAPNEAAATKKAQRILEDDRYENGHSYSGSIGMAQGIRVPRGLGIVSKDDAVRMLFGYPKKTDARGMYDEDQWVNGLAEKWGPAILVRIRNKGSRKALWLLGAECAS